ncbi:hypothetical protein L0222_20745 [bacterium]|nr:hypothetical protein [bacterium]
MIKAKITNLLMILILQFAADALAGQTSLVGGSGGQQTVIMDCGSNAFMVGVSATGGKDGTFGFNLVRRIKFTCQTFNGTTPGASTTQTVEAVAAKAATVSVSSDSRSCPSGAVIEDLDLYAGNFIDRLAGFGCLTSSATHPNVSMNIGGDGGTRSGLTCPATEGLFKVEARVGDAIDSLRGFCRSFGSLANESIPTQILATVSPKPSFAAPVKILPGASKNFQFTISSAASTPQASVGITGETDLLGGAKLNPPAIKLELINPSGSVVVSKIFSDVKSGIIQSVKFGFNVNGNWKLRVTNLKKDIGAVDIMTFSAFIL